MSQDNKSYSESMISLLSTSKTINNPYFLWIIWVLFLLTLISSLFIMKLQLLDNKELDTGLLQLFLTTLGILFTISFVANEWRKRLPINSKEFVEKFYKDFSISENNFKIVEKKRFSLYKNLLQYKNNIYIGIHLEEDNFYIYSENNEIIKNLIKNWATEIDSKNVYFNKINSGSYEERILQLQEYINFVKDFC